MENANGNLEQNSILYNLHIKYCVVCNNFTAEIQQFWLHTCLVSGKPQAAQQNCLRSCPLFHLLASQLTFYVM